MIPAPEILRAAASSVAGGDAAIAEALVKAMEAAYAIHPSSWLAPADVATALKTRADDADTIAKLHAADVYLAVACARGVPGAVETFEREHLARVPELVARVERDPRALDELRQVLRVRTLVGPVEGKPSIATYGGRGPLGGWLRITALRAAREHAAHRREERSGDVDAAVEGASPELDIMKERYGAAATAAFAVAIAALDANDRGMLRMHYADGRSLENVATAYGMSRATAARRLSRARQEIVDRVRQTLADELGVGRDEADSLLAFVRSRLHITLRSQSSEAKDGDVGSS